MKTTDQNKKAAQVISEHLWGVLQESRHRILQMLSRNDFVQLRAYLRMLADAKADLGLNESEQDVKVPFSNRLEVSQTGPIGYLLYTFLLADGWDQFTAFLEGVHDYDANGSLKKELKNAVSRIDDLEGEQEALTNQVSAAHDRVLSQKQKIKALQMMGKKPSRQQLYDIADDTRKRNGNYNWSAIARKLGTSDKTAKSWCKEVGIKG